MVALVRHEDKKEALVVNTGAFFGSYKTVLVIDQKLRETQNCHMAILRTTRF